MYKDIGRILDGVMGPDEEDMQGVYTTGIAEIVGQARVRRKKARKAPLTQGRRPSGQFPPMRMQKVPGVPGPKPRVEIITMPEMKIYAGPVDPRTQRLDASTQMLLQMIRRDGPTRVDAAPIARERSVWPGSRGRYNY